ncbi:hypothetical protein EDD86DRAFT_215393 [Gorgonomyces haynaldii]|nr:hypothetical protein EDD86DRAFT_215393 [Gorgonomyces haynaldii]
MDIPKTVFLAENTLVEIVPKTTIPQIKLISGSYGPFKPLIKTQVPLWLGLTLQKNYRATIVQPQWLNELQDLVQYEQTHPTFAQLPRHYLELARLIETTEEQKQQLAQLRDIRLQKIRLGLQSLDGSYLQTDNFSAIEMESIREFCTIAFRELKTISE